MSLWGTRLRPFVSTIVGSKLALLLVGCGAASSSARPLAEEPAPHLRGAVDAAPQDAEAALGPPPPPPPSPPPLNAGAVSLSVMLAYADEHSPLLFVARSTRSRAEAARAAASLLLPGNPELTVAVGPRRGTAGTGVDVEVSLMQQLEIAGERCVRQEAAKRLGDVTDAEIEQIRWAVHCDVHAGFHRALVEQERVHLAQRVVAFQQDVLRVVERQIAAGETAPLTLRLAQAEVAQSRQVLVAAQQASTASRIRLSLLSGWPPATPPQPAGSFDVPRDPPPLAELGRIAAQKLPSVRAGAARLREARARAAVAAREAWPRPSVGVQYQREGNPGAEGVYDVWMGVLSVPVPLARRNEGERARAHADVKVAEAEVQGARRMLEAQIAEARSEVVSAAARSQAYGSEILPRFEENLTLLRRSFELGEIDILALSTGRERFLRIQSDAISAQQDYFVALAGLERVVGIDLWHDEHH